MTTYSWSEFSKLTGLPPTKLGRLHAQGLLKYRVAEGKADYRANRYYTEEDLKYLKENFNESGYANERLCPRCNRVLPREKLRLVRKIHNGVVKEHVLNVCRECENKANVERNTKNSLKRKVKQRKLTTYINISNIDWDRNFESLIDTALSLDIQVIFGTRINFAISELIAKFDVPTDIPEQSLNFRVLNYNGTIYDIAIRNNDHTRQIVKVHK
jgi:DNA-binding transcriptional MerR regulator